MRCVRFGVLATGLNWPVAPEAGMRGGAHGRGVAAGLQRRLLGMLLVPLCLLALISAWFDYRLADNAAIQQDRQLQQLLPLLAGSIVASGAAPSGPPVLLMAPSVEEFVKDRAGLAGFAVTDLAGRPLLGDGALASAPPTTREPEFRSDERNGITYRVAAQRVQTQGGELVVWLADGSDSRQSWLRSVALKVLLPNLVLALAAALAVNWAVRRALRPLTELTAAVEHRSPRDLSAIDEQASPEEVRPLVRSLNRLFGLVNAQAESQRRFVADAAHQLRTPLAGLQAQVEAWAQAVSAKSRSKPHDVPTNGSLNAIEIGADQIHHLRQAARRTSQLASQLLALSRADARTADGLPMQRVDLQAVCETVLEAQLDAATARRMDLGLEAQPAHVMGHEWVLRELMMNLVDNAIRYTPEGGTVTLRCGYRPDTAEAEDDEAVPGHGTSRQRAFVEVEDDGPGVALAERSRVLERFYRVPGTQGEGSGLGLAIADEIARVHGTQLQLASGPQGRGLCVTLVFPAPG